MLKSKNFEYIRYWLVKGAVINFSKQWHAAQEYFVSSFELHQKISLRNLNAGLKTFKELYINPFIGYLHLSLNRHSRGVDAFS